MLKLIKTCGYWIKSLKNQTLTVEGNESSYPINFNLIKGWNLISYPSLNITLVNESNVTYILTYKDGWLSYSSNKTSYLNTLKNLTPGYGYYVKVSDNVTWVFDGTFK